MASNPVNGKLIDFVIQDPWLADDDTDIEYVYLHLLNQHQTTELSPGQIAEGWKKHINRRIWVSNRRARDLMDEGAAGRDPRRSRGAARFGEAEWLGRSDRAPPMTPPDGRSPAAR